MVNEEIAAIVKERIQVAEETGDNWDYGVKRCWEKCTMALSQNIDESIAFFQNECTDEEFYWLSEVFEEIAEKTKSKDLIIIWRRRLAKVTAESYHQQDFISEQMRKWVDYTEYVRKVNMEIDYAESRIEGTV